MQYLPLFIITGLFDSLLGQRLSTEEAAQERFCQTYTTCNSCVQAESYCVWCYQENFGSDRCGPKSALMDYGCDKRFIFVNGENSTIASTDSDKDFHDVTNPNNVKESVQIKPQRLTVKLQPKQPLTFQFKYRLANNYPLDLYYLMDLTYTMEHDVKTMANLGMELTDMLQNLTKHFKVAFGYYSDKVAMPFSKMTETFLQNPCTYSNKQCERAFDFVHSLNFTEKVDEFTDKVSASKITSNLDNLEGGMDALYQIILCKEHIGWRESSRKIIVVATDGTLHFAGDGILAGVVRRNHDQCLLDQNGVYSQSLVYDYPSLEEVYRRLWHYKMNVLFAAKEDALAYYKDLHKIIPGVSYVGELEEKSANVLKLVEEGYFNVVKQVEFSANVSNNIKVTFMAKCNKMGQWNMSSMCNNVEVGNEYLFNVTLEVMKIPTDRERDLIIIEEKNIAEKLFIEVEYIGNCKCDTGASTQTCSNHGVYKCGICECEDGWRGKACEKECTSQLFEDCREKNESYTSSTCYGRGDCDCGKCMCDEEYTGKFCQEKQCPKDGRGKPCGGIFRGVCEDGICKCRAGYTGDDCSCPVSQNNCKAPGSDVICSGKGRCNCGKCECSTNIGDYCEICPTCTESSGLCNTYEGCVLDTLSNITGSERCFTKDGTAFIPKIMDNLNVTDTTTCYIIHEREDGFSCNTQYNYNIRKDLLVDLEIYTVCYKPVQAYTYIGIIIGAIIGIGLLLILIYKAKLMGEDRREYARFKEAVEKNETLANNPLYNSPIRTYTMPLELQQYSSGS